MADIRNLDLNLLKALDALLTERSVTRAADRLNLTQPAVSGMLARLRDAFDDPLFSRTQHGVIPTMRALQLAAPVRQVLAEVETLLQPAAFVPEQATFTVSLAATDYALQAVAVPFIARMRQRAPGIRIAIRSSEDSHIISRFERGELDLALMTPQSAPPDLHSRRLFDENYVCAMRSTHPDAQTDTLSLDRFCALDHALVSYTGERFRGVTDDALARQGRRRHVAVSVTSFLVLAEVLRSTDLIAVVPKRLMAKAAGLTLVEPPIKIPGFTKLAVWHERTHHDVGHRWVRSLLFDGCRV